MGSHVGFFNWDITVNKALYPTVRGFIFRKVTGSRCLYYRLLPVARSGGSD